MVRSSTGTGISPRSHARAATGTSRFRSSVARSATVVGAGSTGGVEHHRADADGGAALGRAEVHRVAALNAVQRRAWELALFHAETARAVALERDSALLAAECAAIAARALQATGRSVEAAERRAEAEAGFRRLGASSLLERLAEELGS